MGKNVFIAQSGGPHTGINESVRGVIDAIQSDKSSTFGTIYAGKHGVEGGLEEQLLNVSTQDHDQIELLSATPAAGVFGTCRYKLPKVQLDTLLEKVTDLGDIRDIDVMTLDEDVQDYVRLIQVFDRHDIGFFFYAGGNDSMDTCNKLNQAARQLGVDLVCTGVPKTVDNDVGDADRVLVDHTPGYGSVVRFWSDMLQNIDQENRGIRTSDPVVVAQVMGRKIGYLPAGARLADPERKLPLGLILTEMIESKMEAPSGATESDKREIAQMNRAIATRNMIFCEYQTDRLLHEHGRAMIVTSEGTYFGGGRFTKDSFGHEGFSTGISAAVTMVLGFNAEEGVLKYTPGNSRFDIPGLMQRSAIEHASVQDLVEAYESGKYAVGIALSEASVGVDDRVGYMATIQRGTNTDGGYMPIYDKVELSVVAAVDRAFPHEWLDIHGADVTDDFLAYVEPLARRDGVTMKHFGQMDHFVRARDAGRKHFELVLPLKRDGRKLFADMDKSPEMYANQMLTAYTPVRNRAA